MMVPPAAEFAQSLDPDRAAPARPDELQARERPALWRLLLDAVWYHRTVRAQLLITVMLIEVVAAVIAGGVTILKARTSTRVEIAASMNLAELLVNETIPLIDQNVPAEQALASLPLHLRFLRHVRISVKDAQGRLVETRPTPNLPDAAKADDRAPAPAWFAALVAPPVETRAVPVIVGGQRIGSVLVVGEPGDEIAEVWENTVALASVALVGNVAIIGLLYLLFGRVLGPLSGLARGLRDLERRNYRVRLARPGARELAGIADRFNALAEALDTARAENSRLNHRLITAQDDERRRTALELHDEVGPCLFGLKANATSIAAIAGGLPDRGQCAGACGRHARHRRSPAGDQPQPAQPPAADGAGPHPAGRSPARGLARARAPISAPQHSRSRPARWRRAMATRSTSRSIAASRRA